MYATTRQFLDYFNLKSLEQLPPLSEVRDLDDIGREIEQHLEAKVELELPADQMQDVVH